MESSDNGSPENLIHCLTLVGRQEGLVKRMDDFDKSRHTVPKFASDRAQQFLARLAEPELVEWGEELFADFRSAMGYRRKDISLEVENGIARIESKDFVLERKYSLQEDCPDSYDIETELMNASGVDLLEHEAFNQTVGSLFERMRCVFPREVLVEDLVDGIEDAEDGGVTVTYPSTCEYCDARIEGQQAIFRFDSATLEIRYPSYGMPRQLIASYRVMAEELGEVSAVKDLLRLW